MSSHNDRSAKLVPLCVCFLSFDLFKVIHSHFSYRTKTSKRSLSMKPRKRTARKLLLMDDFSKFIARKLQKKFTII